MKYLLVVTMFAFLSLGVSAQTGSGQTGSGQTGSGQTGQSGQSGKSGQSGQNKSKKQWNKSDSTGTMHQKSGGKAGKTHTKTKSSTTQNSRDTTM